LQIDVCNIYGLNVSRTGCVSLILLCMCVV